MENPVVQLFFFELAKGLVLFFGLSTSAFFFILGICVLRNGSAWESNREAVRMYNSGCPLTSMPYDYRHRINPGIAVHIKSNTWVAIGSVSDEGIIDALS